MFKKIIQKNILIFLMSLAFPIITNLKLLFATLFLNNI